MGKRQIGELQAFELVITLLLAELSIIPMQDREVPVLAAIMPLLALVILHFLLSLLARKTMLMRKLFSGQPVLVIENSTIKYEALKKLSMNINDLEESLRNEGYFSFSDVEYAIIETNGKLSVLSKTSRRPVSNEDLKNNIQQEHLEFSVVIDGKIIKHNLQKIKISDTFLFNTLKELNQPDIATLLVVTLSKNGHLFIQPKVGKSKNFDIKLEKST
jgi:uncharacterized membrane protein YcaP (DUF421 family)